MKTLVVGANGKIGRQLLKKMKQAKTPCKAMIRNAEQEAYFSDLGLETVIADLNDDLTEAMKGCDRVVFSAGSGSGAGAQATLIVDLWGCINVVKQAEKNGICSFIMISSLKACNPLRGPERIRHYLVARHLADEKLLAANIKEKVILRPGRLIDEAAKEKFSSKFDWSDTTNSITTVSRSDVVQVIMHILENPVKTNSIIDFINGEVLIDELLEKYYLSKVAN